MFVIYGMKLRPAGPGAQPKENLAKILPGTHDFWNLLAYRDALPESEVKGYDLTYIGRVAYLKDIDYYYAINGRRTE